MRLAVLGDPVDHSLSPALHRAAYADLGLGWTYGAVRVGAGGLRDFLDGLDQDWRGLSLTMPLKREVMPLATTVSERAELAGAANTVVLVDGDAHVDNTDLPGAIAALRERYDGPLSAATILGAGATAASVGLALCELGATQVTLLARSADRAETTVRAIARHPSRPEVRVADLGTAGPVGEVVVSTVPAAAQTAAVVDRCREVPVVFEVVYDPWPTPLAASVEPTSGRVLVGGLDLLVHQAALQVEAFTGLPAPLGVMRAAGETALTSRRTAT